MYPSKENIVDTLRDNIRNTRYIVMFIKVNEKRYHEVLLYGFDDEAQAFETVACPNTDLAPLRYRILIWRKP